GNAVRCLGDGFDYFLKRGRRSFDCGRARVPDSRRPRREDRSDAGAERGIETGLTQRPGLLPGRCGRRELQRGARSAMRPARLQAPVARAFPRPWPSLPRAAMRCIAPTRSRLTSATAPLKSPDRFVAGCGLDYRQLYRTLPYIAVVKPPGE